MPLDETDVFPFQQTNATMSLQASELEIGFDGLTMDAVRDQPQVLIATLPQMTTEYGWIGLSGCINMTDAEGNVIISAIKTIHNASIISCKLYSTSYHSEITVRSGIQTIDSRLTAPYDKVTASQVVFGLNLTSNARTTYNATYGRTLAYQSVSDAFANILSGSINAHKERNGLVQTTNTTIMSTVLSSVAEITFLDNYRSKMSCGIQQGIEESFEEGNKNVALSVTDSGNATLHMIQALEQLSQNMTMGLMTSPQLQYVHMSMLP